MLRALIKSAVSGTLARSGGTRLLRRRGISRTTPLVLGYHRVVGDFTLEAKRSIPAMLVTPAMLEQQLDWVGGRFRFATLDEVAGCLQAGGQVGSGKPMAAVTFDDGYRDVYYNALPLLRRKGIPAAVFVVTDLVGTRNPQTHDLLYLLLRRAFAAWRSPGRELVRLLQRLDLPPVEGAGGCGEPFTSTGILLSTLSRAETERIVRHLSETVAVSEKELEGLLALDWAMIDEMRSSGFTIGSHSRSHALLTNEAHGKVVDELSSSRQRLETQLRAPVRHFAYPDGRFNSAVVGAAVAAGYHFGYTVCRHRHPAHPLMTIPRRMLWERSCLDSLGRFSGSVMDCQVSGVFDRFARCAQDHVAPVARARPGRVRVYERLESG